MNKAKRERFVWEELSSVPCIYRIGQTDSEDNSYLLLDENEALIIDPRSEKMLKNICSLAVGLGARQEGIQVYLTHAGTGKMREIMNKVPDKTTLYCRMDHEASKGGKNGQEAVLSGPAKERETLEDQAGDNGVLQELREQEGDAAYPMRSWTDVRNGDSIRIGKSLLKVIGMEGCFREQTGLWIPDAGIVFAGEAIRCDRLPPIKSWDSRVDTLAIQIETLRRVRGLEVQCILTGAGPMIGLDNLSEDRQRRPEKITPDCEVVLDTLLAGYCTRILEVYQKIPDSGRILAEEITGRDGSPEGAFARCCLRYLLYRQYVVRDKEEENVFYERGSMRLTDWKHSGRAKERSDA